MASILVVCTGNVCRSPIAEGMLRRGLEARFGDDAPLVASAGTAGWDGSPAMPESVVAAAERGVDIGAHVARRLTADHARAADLVVAMAAEHRKRIARAVPEAAGRTFTLKELTRLLEALPPGEPGATALGAWSHRVAEADALRRATTGSRRDDEDIVDPLGLPIEAYRAVAWELEEWCERLVDGLAGSTATPSSANRTEGA
ncbi:MAG TPA: low molecular weight phosphatase family protein [Actinomycetota bacterium]|nr:low molecular weight phosphatase family protein [Actinomycetota bacterium]